MFQFKDGKYNLAAVLTPGTWALCPHSSTVSHHYTGKPSVRYLPTSVFWSGILFLIALFPDHCLLLPSSIGNDPYGRQSWRNKNWCVRYRGVGSDEVSCFATYHFNDLPDSIKSRASLFADDTIV